MLTLLPATLLLSLLGCPATPTDTGEKDTNTADDADYDGYTVDEGDCDDTDANVHPGATETYYDGIDQDCDGEDADDQDGDGFLFAEDCDDLDAEVNPDATEVCDGVDNDCDGSIDVGAADSFVAYGDADADGYGDAGTTTSYCEDLPAGYSLNDTDCDDGDDTVHPGAPEICDDLDNDCDGEINEGLSDEVTYYRDVDADGFGDPGDTTLSCDAPEGYVLTGDDCDDADGTINPAADELCDDVDRDCDGDPVNSPVDGGTYYTDADGDTYGDDTTAVSACEQPEGTVAMGGDCDDTDATALPGGTEVCDGADNDCNGTIDDGFDTFTWYADTDGDTYGNSGDAVLACAQPDGYVTDATDCDDTTAAAYPGATEECDGIDNDCNGSVDESGTEVNWYTDADGDSYGDPATAVLSCAQPATDAVLDATDCNDADPAISPAGVETCDAVDNDCDGEIDEAGSVGAPTWYADLDADTYGDAASTMDACEEPSGYVSNASDCDDVAPTTYPGAPEECDGLDNDCDGVLDNGLSTTPFYMDGDSDGYGADDMTVDACLAPEGYVDVAGDCDDTSAVTNPGAAEECDGLDNNCDGTVDEGVTTTTWFMDADADGYGDDGMTMDACAQPEGYVDMGGDCDDTVATTNPGATEQCDSIDNDCDGAVDDDVAYTDYYVDGDTDGYGDDGTVVSSCVEMTGYASVGGDCDDAVAAVNPGATEACNDIDDNCDGDVDEAGATGSGTFYMDADADGYGTTTSLVACEQPSGYSTNNTDCNDASAAINPAATEVCDNVDNDCDGTADDGIATVTSYTDADGDGYGDSSTAVTDCEIGDVLVGGDCDDTEFLAHPGATESCDGIDNDCDSSVDEAGSAGEVTYYRDADSDAYGSASVSVTQCDMPSGYVTNSTDCNDSAASAHPGATEACDSIDNDCDGSIDESGATGETTWYRDADSDSYGGTTTTSSCSLPSGYVATSTDCNDSNAAVHPGATEVCNSIDDNCDGTTDGSGAVDADTAYPDDDLDGYGDDASVYVGCSVPSGYIADGGDCDDTNDMSYPGADEWCDGEDNNCDGSTSDEAGIASYLDTTGAWTDWTAALAAGTAAAPVSFGNTSSYSPRIEGGTLYLCDGHWYAKGVFSSTSPDASIIGRNGPAVTTLDGGGSASGSVISVTSSYVSVEGLTITGGTGSSSKTYGAGVIASKTASPVPTTPNITLTDCIVTGNSTSYGGGVAVLGYAWIALIDTVVDSNTASTAGGGVWLQNYGAISCDATELGAAGFHSNSSPIGGAIYLSNSSSGTVDAMGCDWGDDGVDDNATYDIRRSPGAGGPGWCYKNATSLTETVTCASGSCTTSTDASCP